MKTKDFIEQVRLNPELITSFHFMDEKLVPDHYHITEIKNIIAESVDCGKTKHIEKTTLVQLWSVDSEVGKHQLSNKKIKHIFEGIDKSLGLNMDAEILFEFGDDNNRTSSYKIEGIVNTEKAIIVNLHVPQTECKPRKLLNSLSSCC